MNSFHSTLLYKLFELSDNDIKCIEYYKTHGEGRLSEEKINEFKNYKLKINTKNTIKNKTFKQKNKNKPIKNNKSFVKNKTIRN